MYKGEQGNSVGHKLDKTELGMAGFHVLDKGE